MTSPICSASEALNVLPVSASSLARPASQYISQWDSRAAAEYGKAMSVLPTLAHNRWQALQGANISCDCHIHFLHRQSAWPEHDVDMWLHQACRKLEVT